tara:strand:+ start:1034 stop:1681 length:648 start_codon:yes stop_codon:yes gene_type:complete
MFMRGDVFSYLRHSVRGQSKEDAISIVESALQKIRFRWIGCNGEDIHRFYSSLEGRVYSFWQSIRDCGLSYEEAKNIYIDQADKDEEWESKVKFSIEMTTGEADVCRLYKICGLTRRDSGSADGYLINKKGLFSTLFKEPFGYTPNQIADMTLGQISLVIGDSEKGAHDIDEEKNLESRPNNPGTRRMKGTYKKPYHEMAVNLVNGYSLTSGLIS